MVVHGKLQSQNLLILIMENKFNIQSTTPLITSDCVIFSNKKVLLIKRKFAPYKNCWALPGGFVENNESTEQACVRELHEETTVKVKTNELTLLGVYSEPGRDPRGPIVTVAYFLEKKINNFKARDDACDINFFDNWKKLDLAFDHAKIITDAERILKGS